MNVLIRVDASVEIGTGHVMRCLTIAKELKKEGCKVSFFMKDLVGNLIDYVRNEGFRTIKEFEPAHLCIIDHYGCDAAWERSIRPYVEKIIVIDDLADRMHDCDILLDQNMVSNYLHRYDQLLPAACVKLLGPKYLIMRDEFVTERQKARLRTKAFNNLLVFMGGTDPTNETEKVLLALQQYNPFKTVHVVVGSSNPRKDRIASLCHENSWYFHCQIDYMAVLMRKADFSIGTGGSTIWERCYVGLPGFVTTVAKNQIEATEMASKLGVCKNLGWHEGVTASTYEQRLRSLNSVSSSEWEYMSKKGMELTGATVPNPWVKKFMEVLN